MNAGITPSNAVSRGSAPVVRTSHGEVRGRVEGNEVFGYLGIRYAADSGVKGRFLPPVSPPSWSGVFDATEFGPACPQTPLLAGDRHHDEDCLRINVWTRSTETARPVVVWFHGGAYTSGHESYPGGGADGARAAEEDIVFVSLTHRLNAFGFLQLPEEFGPAYASSGNVGMLDLAAGLEWVQENIGSFGGDPSRVTIAGTSGGGSKVLHALTMPAFNGLFSQAMIFSGHDLWKTNTRESAERMSAAVLRELGITVGDVEALWSLPADHLVRALGAVTQAQPQDPEWGLPAWMKYDILSPHVDGSTLPLAPVLALEEGAGADVDLIVNVDELTHWFPFRAAPDAFDSSRYGRLTLDELVQALEPDLGRATREVIDAYRHIMPGASPSSLLATVVTDRDWLVPAVQVAEAKARGGLPARLSYNRATSVTLYGDMGVIAGSHHYLWGSGGITAGPGALTGQVQEAFVRFAASGDPCHEGLPVWNRFVGGKESALVLDHDITITDALLESRRAVWRGLR